MLDVMKCFLPHLPSVEWCIGPHRRHHARHEYAHDAQSSDAVLSRARVRKVRDLPRKHWDYGCIQQPGGKVQEKFGPRSRKCDHGSRLHTLSLAKSKNQMRIKRAPFFFKCSGDQSARRAKDEVSKEGRSLRPQRDCSLLNIYTAHCLLSQWFPNNQERKATQFDKRKKVNKGGPNARRELQPRRGPPKESRTSTKRKLGGSRKAKAHEVD